MSSIMEVEMWKAFRAAPPMKQTKVTSWSLHTLQLVQSRFVARELAHEMDACTIGTRGEVGAHSCEVWWSPMRPPARSRAAYLMRVFSAAMLLLRPARAVRASVLLVDAPRRLPETRGAMITPFHVNGGVCSGSDILVYRDEDAAKVLLHEVFHAVGARFRCAPSTPPTVQAKWRVTNPLLLDEAYVEYLARMAMCGAVDGPLKRVKERRKAMNERARMVADRVLWHFGGGPFSEDTNAFCYTVACWVMMSADPSTDLERALLRAKPPDKLRATTSKSLKMSAFA
jgi:hypothetical protein